MKHGNNHNKKGEKTMYKDNRYINAGENEIYRYGHKAVEKVQAFLNPNENGYYSFPVDGNKYWTIGTSNGKFGEFARIGETIFSVNKGGYMYAKVGTAKAEAFVKALNWMVEEMHKLNNVRGKEEE